VLPDTAGRLAAKTSRISACSLHADVSSTLNPDSEGNLLVCLVCRGTTLEILQIPSLDPIMSFSSASAGLPVMDSSEGEPVFSVQYYPVMHCYFCNIQSLENGFGASSGRYGSFVFACTDSLVDTWLPSIVEIAMVTPHDRQKASADSHLDIESLAAQSVYLIMLLSGQPCGS
jgi:hypothetical protein